MGLGITRHVATCNKTPAGTVLPPKPEGRGNRNGVGVPVLPYHKGINTVPRNWTIQRCQNIPGGNEDKNAFVDYGTGACLIGGWYRGWDYIAGNAEPGDTVTVLEPDTRTANEVGHKPAPRP